MTTVRSALFRLIICLAVISVLTGCPGYTGNPLNDEDNPDFLAGKRRNSSMDFSGAIAAFEKALQANPNSAAAHFELGLLCEQRSHDYASAIHHYQKHLKLRPESNVSDTVMARINSCKVELAKTVSFSLVSQEVFEKLTHLTTENTALRQKIMELNMQLAGVTPAPSQSAGGNSEQASPPAVREPPKPAFRSSARSPQTAQSGSVRSYVLKKSDTFYSLSKKFGVTLQAIQAANPGMNARQLTVGRTIKIPPSGN